MFHDVNAPTTVTSRQHGSLGVPYGIKNVHFYFLYSTTEYRRNGNGNGNGNDYRREWKPAMDRREAACRIQR